MSLSKETIVGLEAIALTSEILWNDTTPEDKNDRMLALVEKAGSPQDFMTGVLAAGDVLLRGFAGYADESPAALVAILLDELG